MVDAYITAEVKIAGLNVPPNFFFLFQFSVPLSLILWKGKQKQIGTFVSTMESFTVTRRYSGFWIHAAVPLCLCAGKGTWRKEQIQHRAKKKVWDGRVSAVMRKKSGKMWNIYNVIRSREVTADLFPVSFSCRILKSIYVSWGGTRQQLWVYKNHSNGYNIYMFYLLFYSSVFCLTFSIVITLF